MLDYEIKYVYLPALYCLLHVFYAMNRQHCCITCKLYYSFNDTYFSQHIFTQGQIDLSRYNN